MKQCKCEHWQTCPICYPQGFDAAGNRLPPELTPLQKASNRIEELEQQLAASEADRDALIADACRWRWITRDHRLRELRIPANESKASIDAAIDKKLLDAAWERDPDQ